MDVTPQSCTGYEILLLEKRSQHLIWGEAAEEGTPPRWRSLPSGSSEAAGTERELSTDADLQSLTSCLQEDIRCH